MAKALRLTQIERKEISDSKMLEAAVDLIVERGAGQAKGRVIHGDLQVIDLAIKSGCLILYSDLWVRSGWQS
jgi:hypothetical protein